MISGEKIKINFTDFWSCFDKNNNFFFNLLDEKYNVEISDEPDFIFFSVFGSDHLNYNCVKIFYTGENISPNFEQCDYSFSFDEMLDTRNYRLPHYVLYDGYYGLIDKKINETLLNRKFCNFIVSNGSCPERNYFFERLSEYKTVDSGGLFMNNIGYRVDDKLKFQSEYKFSIAFENDAYRPGYEWYITEKVMEPMIVNSVPIYKGGYKIIEDFNSKSIVNCHDFDNIDDIINYIIYLDNNDSEYLKVLGEPWFNDGEIPENNKKENIKEFLYKIFII